MEGKKSCENEEEDGQELREAHCEERRGRKYRRKKVEEIMFRNMKRKVPSV